MLRNAIKTPYRYRCTIPTFMAARFPSPICASNDDATFIQRVHQRKKAVRCIFIADCYQIEYKSYRTISAILNYLCVSDQIYETAVPVLLLYGHSSSKIRLCVIVCRLHIYLPFNVFHKQMHHIFVHTEFFAHPFHSCCIWCHQRMQHGAFKFIWFMFSTNFFLLSKESWSTFCQAFYLI